MTARTLLRAAIVALAATGVLYFYDSVAFTYNILTRGGAHWYDALPALTQISALASAGLAIANKRLVLSVLLLVATSLLYFAPILPFAIAVAIYGV